MEDVCSFYSIEKYIMQLEDKLADGKFEVNLIMRGTVAELKDV